MKNTNYIFRPERAFDGDLGQQCNPNGCSHTGNAKINWLQVDLEQKVLIYRVKIYNRKTASSRLRDATIEIADSDDMILNKQLCASFWDITTTNQIENFNCQKIII